MEYDARTQIPIGTPREGELLISLTLDEYDALAKHVYDDPTAPSQRVRCSGVLDPDDAKRVIVRGTRDEVDHVLDFLIGEALYNDPQDEAIPNLWRCFDDALAKSGDTERHERRDDRIRSFMRDRSGREAGALSYTFPRILEGYALVEPERAARLRTEWEGSGAESPSRR
jgi:hypothetical protein